VPPTGAIVGGAGAAADAGAVDASVPNDAVSIWDDGECADEEAKALIPTHCSSVWMSVMLDSKGCADITQVMKKREVKKKNEDVQTSNGLEL